MLGQLLMMGACGGAGGDELPVAGAMMWYDASDTASLTLSGSEVVTWADKTGNGWTMTRASAGAGPTSGAITQNGLNVLRFSTSGTNQWMNTNGISADLTVTAAGGVTMFGVARPTGSSGNGGYFFLGQTRLWAITHKTASGTGSYGGHVPAVTWIDTTQAGETSGAAYSCQVLAFTSGAPYKIRRNGTALTLSPSVSNDPRPTTALSYYSLGGDASAQVDVDICEIIAYKTELSTSDIQAVEDYLIDKWGI